MQRKPATAIIVLTYYIAAYILCKDDASESKGTMLAWMTMPSAAISYAKIMQIFAKQQCDNNLKFKVNKIF